MYGAAFRLNAGHQSGHFHHSVPPVRAYRTFRPGHGPRPGPGYGEIWWPKTSRLAKCPDMQDAYDAFLDAREKKKKCKGCFLGIGKGCSCRKRWEDAMEALERKGDAAWKRCKVQEEREELELIDAVVTSVDDEPSSSSSSSSSGGSGSSTSSHAATDPYYDTAVYDASAGNLAAAGAAPAAGGKGNMMLYAGIGLGGLALVLMLTGKK